MRLWSLSENTLVEPAPEAGQLVVLTRWGEIKLVDAGPIVHEALRRMTLGPVHLENLPLPPGTNPQRQASRLADVLDRLGCCVVQSLGLDDESGPLLSVVPVARTARVVRPPRIEPDRPIRLSRFAVIRAGEGNLLLESPVSDYRVILHRPRASWVASALPAPTTIARLGEQLQQAQQVIADIVSYLVASGTVLAGERDGPDGPGTARFAEDDDPDLGAWSMHDLQFHARTRLGRDGGEGSAPTPGGRPAVAPPPDGPRFPLFRPDLDSVGATDPPLTSVLEAGRPLCEFAERPMTATMLGELLFRTSRVRPSVPAPREPDGGTGGTGGPSQSDRSELIELELYLSIDRCHDLPRGTFHYNPREHCLTLVNDSAPDLDELLEVVSAAAGTRRWPPVLVTMTTRIARLSWRYSGIAYALTLRHAGELQQTIQLVATAMGLASCSPPVIDSTAYEALRLRWPDEVSVGEFLVGFAP